MRHGFENRNFALLYFESQKETETMQSTDQPSFRATIPVVILGAVIGTHLTGI